MRLSVHIALGLFLSAAFVWNGVLSCTYRGSQTSGGEGPPEEVSAPRCPFYTCGVCKEPMDITLVFNNVYQAPFFNFNVTVRNKARRELIHFMERAADQDTRARFATKYGGSLGYYIQEINNLAGNVQNKTYWSIVEHISGNGLSLGASHYVPLPNAIIQFNFTTWSTGPH